MALYESPRPLINFGSNVLDDGGRDRAGFVIRGPNSQFVAMDGNYLYDTIVLTGELRKDKVCKVGVQASYDMPKWNSSPMVGWEGNLYLQAMKIFTHLYWMPGGWPGTSSTYT